MKVIYLSILIGCFSNLLKSQTLIDPEMVPAVVRAAYIKEFHHSEETDWLINDTNYIALNGTNRSVLISKSGVIIAEKATVNTQNLPDQILYYFSDIETKEKIIVSKREIILKNSAVFYLIETKNYLYKFSPIGQLLSKDEI